MADPRKRRELTVALLVALALILASLASTRFYFRLDLSSSKAFTLSAAARKLYEQIPERARITYFVSRGLADRHPGPAAIEDLLGELAAVSRGKISFRVEDPTDDPTKANGFGLAPQQMQVVEKSEQRVAVVYSGIVIEYLDRYHAIPAILGAETLEYETVKAIRSLVQNRRTVVGLLPGDGDKSVENDYRTLDTVLRGAGYETRQLARGQPVEPDVDMVFVLGNAAMDRYDAYFVDDFLMRGGKVFFAVKGVDVNPEYNLAASAVPEGGLLSVLSAYGIDVARELVLDQSNLTVPFQTAAPGGGPELSYVRYPHWVALDGRFANASHPVTARFTGLDLFWPSPITLRKLDGLDYQDLVKTTPKAWKQAGDFATGPDEQARYTLGREASEGQYLVGLSVSGRFPSAFALGDLPSREGGEKLQVPASPSKETRIVVVSSADFLTDLMQMSQSGFNASFALSAADWLSSDDDLIAIRTRAETDPRLNRIRDETLRAFMVSLTYFLNLGAVPLAFVLYGILRSWKRSRREAAARPERGGEA